MTEDLNLDDARRRIVATIQRTITGTDYKVPVSDLASALTNEFRAEFEALMAFREGLAARGDVMFRPTPPAIVYHHTSGRDYTILDRVNWPGLPPLDRRELAILRALLQWSMDNLEEADG